MTARRVKRGTVPQPKGGEQWKRQQQAEQAKKRRRLAERLLMM